MLRIFFFSGGKKPQDLPWKGGKPQDHPETRMVPNIGGLELGSLPLPQALTSALHNPPFPPPPEPRRVSLLCYFSLLEFPGKNESPPEKFPLGCGVTHQERQTQGDSNAVSGSGGTIPAPFSSDTPNPVTPPEVPQPLWNSSAWIIPLCSSRASLCSPSTVISRMHPGILAASC